MGVGQSKLPYNVENPRRVRDLKSWQRIIKEYQGLTNEDFNTEVFGSFTAPEFKSFMMGMMMAGMATAMDDPERGNKLNAKWKPWVSIVNNSTETVEAEMWMYRPTKFMEGERIVIRPGETGRLPLPKEVDFNRDYPLNGILNDRCVHLFYENGQEIIMNCGRLNNGMSRGDFVLVNPRTVLTCDEIQETEEQATPEDTEHTGELQDFLAECMDPNCPPLTEAQFQKIEECLKTCIPQLRDAESQ